MAAAALEVLAGLAAAARERMSPGSRYGTVTVNADGSVTLAQRAPHAAHPRLVIPSGTIRQHEQALTDFVQRGVQPPPNIIGLLTDRQWAAILNAAATVVPPAPPEPPGVGGDVPFDPAQPPDTLFGQDHLTPVGVEDYFVPRFVRGLHTSIPGGEAGMRQMPAAVLVGLGATGPRKVRVHRRAAGRRFHAAWAERSRGIQRGVRSRLTGQRIKGRAKKRRAQGRTKARLVKGSRAAKMHMAKLRRMRKR